MNCLIKNYISAFDTFFKYLIADNILHSKDTRQTKKENNQTSECLNDLYNFL